jgi:hypothetical protein
MEGKGRETSITSTEFLGELHLEPFWGSNDNVASSILLLELAIFGRCVIFQRKNLLVSAFAREPSQLGQPRT